MDCTICGKPSLPGAMLCAPCKAALKRARYVTVQEDLRPPSVIDVRRQRRRARAPAATTGARPAEFPSARALQSRPGRRLFVGILVVAAALGSASYFTHRELGARSHDGSSATAPAVTPDVRQEMTAGDAASGNAGATIGPSAVDAGKVLPIGINLASQTPPAAKLAGTAAAKRTVPANRATFATANGDPPDAVAPPPEPEIIAAAPAPPPRAIPDRWQNMRDAMAQCDREGVFGGLVCGQRVRIQYCDGYWGKVAQCQGAAASYER